MNSIARSNLSLFIDGGSGGGMENSQSSSALSTQNQTSNTNTKQQSNGGGQFNLLPYVYLLTKHLNGSLNLWKVSARSCTKWIYWDINSMCG